MSEKAAVEIFNGTATCSMLASVDHNDFSLRKSSEDNQSAAAQPLQVFHQAPIR